MSIMLRLNEIFRPKRMRKLKLFTDLITETKKISSIYECEQAMDKVIAYRKDIPDGDEIMPYIGRLVEYIIDTRIHAEKGCHASQYTEWKTCYTYPDINNYFNFKHKIEHFS